MTKSELVKRLKDKFETLYLKDADTVVDTVLGSISSALSQGRRVELRGFGSFSIRERDPRNARNPKTGEIVSLGKRRSVYFRAGKELRERVNNDN